MLGKLFKHDFRALSRVLVPTHLAILAATIIATTGFAYNLRKDISGAIGGLEMLVSTISVVLSVLMVVAIFASVFLVAFIIFQRFYKSFMCDEGYLTFTLPVKTTQLLWSKLLSAGAWMVINSLLLILCVFIFVAFGTSSTSFFNAQAFETLGVFITEMNEVLGSRLVLPIIEFVVFIIISAAYSLLSVYLALIIGGVLSQNHRLLAAIGAYFGINMLVGVITSVVQNVFIIDMVSVRFNVNTPTELFDVLFNALNPYFLVIMAITAVLAVVFFIVSHYLLKNKLNLD